MHVKLFCWLEYLIQKAANFLQLKNWISHYSCYVGGGGGGVAGAAAAAEGPPAMNTRG